MKKRLCAFVGVVCLMLSAVGLRLRFCRLDALIDGEYTAFASDDSVCVCSISKGYERVDTQGGASKVERILAKAKAKLIKTEKIDADLTVFYAYSPCLLKSVRLFGRNVNLMIALNGNSVVVGSPLIKGSY